MSMEIGRNMMPVQPVQPIQPVKPVEAGQQEGQNEKQGNDLSVTSSAGNNVAAAYNGQQAQMPAIGTGSQNGSKQSTEEQIEQENEKVMKAISEMNKKMTSNTEAVFGIHEDTNRITIKLVDKTTRETIKELPPEKTLDMIAKVWELAGIMVDEKK